MTWVKCAQLPVFERTSPKAQNPPFAIIQEIVQEVKKAFSATENRKKNESLSSQFFVLYSYF